MQVRCINCQAEVVVANECRGQAVTCPYCGRGVVVPGRRSPRKSPSAIAIFSGDVARIVVASLLVIAVIVGIFAAWWKVSSWMQSEPSNHNGPADVIHRNVLRDLRDNRLEFVRYTSMYQESNMLQVKAVGYDRVAEREVEVMILYSLRFVALFVDGIREVP